MSKETSENKTLEEELAELQCIIDNNDLTPEQIAIIEDTKKLAKWMHKQGRT